MPDEPALYEITLTMGDGLGYTRDQMGVFLEGVQFDSVTSSGTEYAINTYQVTVTDGQLTLLLDDLGGDPLVMINGLDVVTAGMDTAGPSVVAAEPADDASGSLDRMTVTFSEAIDAGSFTER